MDAFKVPKKVNRHVLKALNTLCNGSEKEHIPTSQILKQVKIQMRNLVPVPNIDMVVQKSLKNLSDIGLIARVGPQKFALGSSYVPHTISKSQKPESVNRRLFNPASFFKKNSSRLNPNIKRAQHESDESLSGDEYDRTRKRMRTNNKKVIYSGRSTELPKSRQHLYEDVTLSPSFPSLMEGYQVDNALDRNLEIVNDANVSFQIVDVTPNSLNNLSENYQNVVVESDLNVMELYRNNNLNIDDDDPIAYNSVANLEEGNSGKESMENGNLDTTEINKSISGSISKSQLI